ncbi:MAG TPA: carboxypeptidase-like regulatory domain-containing protein, partial [Ferruginibacter sp.]|nr:carboxypeptidase-like regulatory domain-containing protein [Ferruginibacter sp.]
MRYFPESRTRLLTLPLFFLSMLTGLFAQAQSQQLSGRIVIDKAKTPAVSANIFLLRQPAKTFSDASGNFSLKIPTLRKDDTVLISMVGYETLRIPLQAALGRTEFLLREKSKTLEGVTVKAFSTHDVQGSLSESVGYYRSWYSRGNG